MVDVVEEVEAVQELSMEQRMAARAEILGRYDAALYELQCDLLNTGLTLPWQDKENYDKLCKGIAMALDAVWDMEGVRRD